MKSDAAADMATLLFSSRDSVRNSVWIFPDLIFSTRGS